MGTDVRVKKYFDPKEPGSFAGASTFQRHHKDVKDLGNILSGYRSYTLHKPVRRRFQRNITVVGGIDSQWDLDLSDLSKFSAQNDGYKFLLFAIDVFSKKLWVIPTINKTGPTLAKALEKLFSSLTDRRPKSIRTDKGGEFQNQPVSRVLKKYKIHYFTSQNEETKASIVERVQRTIKGRMWRYFTYKKTNRYIDVLDDLVESYNNTYHRSIGRTPNSVDSDNAVHVWDRLYSGGGGGSGDKRLRNTKFKFEIGDHVRIISTRMIFRKAYEGDWTEEIFKIVKRLPRHPPVYRIVDLNDDPIEGTFYGKELQKVKFDDQVFIVEEVLKQRRRNGKTQHFVKWLGYPKSFNSWVDGFIE